MTHTPHNPTDVNDDARDEARDAVTDLMPWAISLMLHAGIVMLAIFLIWSSMVTKDEEMPLATTLNRVPTTQAVVPSPTMDTNAERSSTSRSRSISQATSSSKVTEQITQTKPSGIGPSIPTVIPGGNGTASAGTGDGILPGVPRQAKRIVFLIDASGSLMDSMPLVVSDLKSKLRSLTASQQYTVIFFQGDRALEAGSAGMKWATPENVYTTARWLDPQEGALVPGGKTNPVPGIQLAMKYKPDYVVILSDDITGRGRWALEPQVLLDEVQRANAGRAVIDTVQFLRRDPAEAAGGQPTLKRISDSTGGRYNFIEPWELNIQ